MLNGTTQNKFSPAYFHVNALCIVQNWPDFTPCQLVIPSEVSSKLLGIHNQYLLHYGFMR